MSNILAIVGRPNVGKSTFFNRLTGEKTAIVDPTSGVTRDRHYGVSEWNGIHFSVIDTGGIVVGSDDIFEEEIIRQVNMAVEEADVLVFMLDAKEGLNLMDEEISGMLRRSNKPVFFVANKVDTPIKIQETSEFYTLGVDNLYCISAVNGSGTGELLDEVVKHFNPSEEENIDEIPKIAVVGRPNVGKSSLINVLLGVDRNIVTPIAGTTRDSIYTRYKGFGFDFYLVDTAGLRKKRKVNEDVEFYSTMRSIRAIESCDVCILMIDATQGLEAQDMHIFSLIEKNHKGVVIVVNKWDLVEKRTSSTKEFEQKIYEKIAPFTDVPIVFTSALTKQRIHKALDLVNIVFKNRTKKITTSQLNDFMLPLILNYPPPSTKSKFPKIKFVTQLPLHYPAFAFYSSSHQYIKDSYKRFLENKLREQYDFSGAPMEIFFREK